MNRPSKEKILKVIEDLEGHIIIVEGKKDEKALKSLGLKNIIAINGRPIYRVAEQVRDRNEEIIILTDFDETGNKLNSELRMFIGKYKKRINHRLRKKFGSLGINKTEDVKKLVDKTESFDPSFIREDDFHVKVSTDINKIRYSSSNKRKRSHREA